MKRLNYDMKRFNYELLIILLLVAGFWASIGYYLFSKPAVRLFLCKLFNISG